MTTVNCLYISRSFCLLSSEGELLYIGRNAGPAVDGIDANGGRFPAQCPPHRLIGKVRTKIGRLVIAFRGSEYMYDEYEVLALNQSPASLQVKLAMCKRALLL